MLLDGPKKTQQLENLKQLIRNVGRAGIPVFGYNFSIAGVGGRVKGPFARGDDGKEHHGGRDIHHPLAEQRHDHVRFHLLDRDIEGERPERQRAPLRAPVRVQRQQRVGHRQDDLQCEDQVVLCCWTCSDRARNEAKMRRFSSASERSWKP